MVLIIKYYLQHLPPKNTQRTKASVSNGSLNKNLNCIKAHIKNIITNVNNKKLNHKSLFNVCLLESYRFFQSLWQ